MAGQRGRVARAETSSVGDAGRRRGRSRRPAGRHGRASCPIHRNERCYEGSPP